MRRINTWQTMIVLVLLVGSAAGSFPQTVSAQEPFIPDDLPVITPENAAQVTQVAMLASYGIIGDIAWSPDGGMLALASSNGLVFLLDATQLDTRPHILNGHTAAVTSLAFSPDGTRAATGGYDDGIVRLWDTATGESVAIMDVDSGVTSVEFSPDGTILVSSHHDGSLRMWDSVTGEPLAILDGHLDSALGMGFSPDGRIVASAGGSYVPREQRQDNSVRLWDIAEATQLVVLNGHTRTVNSASFNSAGTLIVSASEDGTIRLWGVG